MIIKDIFSYFSFKLYVVTPHLNHLTESQLGGKFHPRYLPVAFTGIYRSGKYSSSGKYRQILAN